MKYEGMKKLRPCEALELEHKGYKLTFIRSGFGRDLYFVYSEDHKENILDKEVNHHESDIN